MKSITIDVNPKTILIAAVVLLVIFGAFFAGRSGNAEKSDAGVQQKINQNPAPNIPSAGGGCGV